MQCERREREDGMSGSVGDLSFQGSRDEPELETQGKTISHQHQQIVSFSSDPGQTESALRIFLNISGGSNPPGSSSRGSVPPVKSHGQILVILGEKMQCEPGAGQLLCHRTGLVAAKPQQFGLSSPGWV